MVLHLVVLLVVVQASLGRVLLYDLKLKVSLPDLLYLSAQFLGRRGVYFPVGRLIPFPMTHLPVLLTPHVLPLVLLVSDQVNKTKVFLWVRDPCLVISKSPVHFVHVLQCLIVVFSKPNLITSVTVTVAIIEDKTVVRRTELTLLVGPDDRLVRPRCGAQKKSSSTLGSLCTCVKYSGPLA